MPMSTPGRHNERTTWRLSYIVPDNLPWGLSSLYPETGTPSFPAKEVPLKLVAALVALLVVAVAQPALAQGRGHGNDDAPGQGRGKGQGKNQGHGQDQGPGKGQGPGQSQGRDNSPAAPSGNVIIANRDRNAVYSYYRTEYAAGNCPPGLARKNNGCLPPGQARKLWAMGQPLPGSVIFYPLPGGLLGMLTPAPAGYQYVRVANDILMRAIGTRMIVGALADLSAM
jgi:hypothetical protein